MTFIILLIFLILLFTGLIFSPFFQPEVWVEKDGVKVRKFFRANTIGFDQIESLAMTTIGGGSNYLFDYDQRVITIKIKLVNGRSLVLNSFSHVAPEKKMAGILSDFKMELKKIFSRSQGFDEESLLLFPEEIRKILSSNKNIKIDEFIVSYLETGNCSKFLEIAEGYYNR